MNRFEALGIIILFVILSPILIIWMAFSKQINWEMYSQPEE